MDTKELANKRILTYIAVFLGLLFGYVAFRKSAWQSSMHFHTILEVVATLLAVKAGVMALVRFYVKKTNLFLLVGTGFLGTAFLESYHAVVTCERFIQIFPSPPPALIPWSWFAARIFLSIFMFLAWYFCWREKRLGESGKLDENWAYLLSSSFTLISFIFFAYMPLPRAYYPGHFFPRPQEFIAAFFFLLALIGFLRDGEWRKDSFEHWLILSLIVGFMGQAVFMSSSHKLYDFGFDAAHFLKKGSYICVLTGLIIAMYQLFIKERESAEAIQQQAEELQVINDQLQLTSDELEKSKIELAGKVAERTAELSKSNEMLQKKINELEKFTEVAVGREVRIAELKEDVGKLRKELGTKSDQQGTT